MPKVALEPKTGPTLVCAKCGREKLETSFYEKFRDGVWVRESICKVCAAARRKRQLPSYAHPNSARVRYKPKNVSIVETIWDEDR